MGLGPFGDLPLAEARDAASVCRKQLLAGVDPLAARAAAEAVAKATLPAVTFKQVAEQYLTAHDTSWRNAKHRSQWRSSLERFAYPTIGDRGVASIVTGDVMRVIEPIWQTLPETASRVRGRIESILDYAKAREWRGGENPARWRGHIANMLPRRNKARSVQHHSALPWKEMGTFWAALAGEDGMGASALRFTVLTAARTGEITGARWSEINLTQAVWIVPAERMKAGREHRIPLSGAALEVLAQVAEARADKTADGFAFPAKHRDKPLSNMAMAMLLRRMKRGDLTVHGFRSSFRDWVGESTGYPREVAEAALAHSLSNQVEAAYRRGDLFEKRRQLMEDWAKFCSCSE